MVVSNEIVANIWRVVSSDVSIRVMLPNLRFSRNFHCDLEPSAF